MDVSDIEFIESAYRIETMKSDQFIVVEVKLFLFFDI